MKGFDNLYHEFTDKQGRKYYKFATGTMPFIRYQQQKEFLRWLQVGQSEEEQDKLLGYAQEAITSGIKGLATVSTVLNELQFRKNIIRPALVYQMMAVSVVREDEDPLAYSLQIQDEKALTIAEDMNDEMRFFFALKPLMESFLKPPHSKERWQTILSESRTENQRRQNLHRALEGCAASHWMASEA